MRSHRIVLKADITPTPEIHTSINGTVERILKDTENKNLNGVTLSNIEVVKVEARSTEAQTMGDLMREAHPAAGPWMDQTQATLDDIHKSVQAHLLGKKGMMDLVRDSLEKYGYKFEA